MTEDQLNEVASHIYATLREKTDTPSAGTNVCFMVVYFIWKESKTVDFETWFKEVTEMLRELHQWNQPTTETKQ